MDENLLEPAITERTKAIMPVSIYGQVPNMDVINSIAEKHSWPVLEDAAQSFGATYKGKKSCNLATIGSTSFFPSKPLGCYGDAGALFTNDDELAEKFRWIRVHGQERKHHHPILGLNGRMDTLQAAILLAIFEVFPDEVIQREKIGNRYSFSLAGLSEVQAPEIPDENSSVYAQYTIVSERRTDIQNHLKEQDIPSVSYYSVPLHMQACFSELGYNSGDLPVTEAAADTVFSIPVFPQLTADEHAYVANTLIESSSSFKG